MAAWSEKRVDRLMLLHREGFSATVIARKLGPSFTKGMVAGKLRRLSDAQAAKRTAPRTPKGKPVVERVSQKQALPAKRTAAPAQSPIVIAKSAPVQQPSAPHGIRIFELRARHCRWPMGNDRPAQFFCGAPVIPAKSWCEHHYALAYGHRPKHHIRPQEKSPGQLLLRALQSRSKRSKRDMLQLTEASA